MKTRLTEPVSVPAPGQSLRAEMAFTLVEVLLALAICAIVLVAINAVFATAVRLRDRTSAVVAQNIPLENGLETLRRDLKGAVGPGGVLAGDFKCGAQTLGASMGLSGGGAAGSGLDFFTATARIGEDGPWSEVQEVVYQLQPSTNTDQPGQDLVRYVSRNLLPTTLVMPDRQTVLSAVQSVEFNCYDGLEWRPFWDTSSGDTNLPLAVRVIIQRAVPAGSDAKPDQLELTVPLMTVTRTNFTE